MTGSPCLVLSYFSLVKCAVLAQMLPIFLPQVACASVYVHAYEVALPLFADDAFAVSAQPITDELPSDDAAGNRASVMYAYILCDPDLQACFANA